MIELTSQQLRDVIVRALDDISADFKRRERLLAGRTRSPITERVLEGLSADEVAQVLKDLSQGSSG